MSVSEALGEQKEVRLPQGTVRYRERGSGQPVVFAHGLLVNGDLWRKLVPLLAEDFRCITPDLPLGSHSVPLDPGADLTPTGVARLIADFLEALGLEGVTLVGSDTGGGLCQIVVTEHPERVARLVLTNCDGFEVFPPLMFKYLSWVARVPGATFALTQSMRLTPVRRLPMAFGMLTNEAPERAVSDSFVDPSIHDAGVRRDLVKFLKTISPEYTLAAARRFREFHQPVLVAWGDRDRFFTMELGKRIAAAFPDARLEVIAGARTFVAEDAPGRLAELIHEFAGQQVAVSA
jgi:pimeloyl-ACP methyl ester carboxylesterase